MTAAPASGYQQAARYDPDPLLLMEEKSRPSPGFFCPRLLVTLAACLSAASIVTGALREVLRPEAADTGSQRTLTFAERVAYQRAIEEVYWRHRIWPRSRGDRPDSKPSLDAVMSQAQVEKKVTDYLRKSQALEDYWQRPITAEQLQGEMDRMVKHTKQSEVLQELFAALGNDPFVIAECLARPALAERLLAHMAHGEPINRSLRRIVDTSHYSVPTILDPNAGCVDDTWAPINSADAPPARAGHTAVWTGTEMIIWGGSGNINTFNTGGRYSPSTDSWTAASTTNAPSARSGHTAVWTGTEMIVWGGGSGLMFNTGGRYNPSTDSWTATSTSNAPSPRVGHTAVWNGSEMVVWGGLDDSITYFNTGGRYNPTTDSWTTTNTSNAPTARASHTAVWAGGEMIVWGGHDAAFFLFDTGGRYDPVTNSWTATGMVSAPSGRARHTAIWTGNQMIVWGGLDVSGFETQTGGRFNPGTNSWIATSVINAPSARQLHTAVWTGGENIVWGGIEESLQYPNTGGKYDPIDDAWTASSTVNAPSGRTGHTAIWTGTNMIVWGGAQLSTYLNTGARYCVRAGPTPTPTPIPRVTPTPRPRSTPHPRP